MYENPVEKHRDGHGAHNSHSVESIAQDFTRLGYSSSQVLYGGYDMNGATLSGVVDAMNRKQGESS